MLGCSTKKNTQGTRMYHELNTRYNVYFNAKEAYNTTLKSEEDSREDNLSKLMDVIPVKIHENEKKEEGGSFNTSVDKTTKAIKLHSITTKPKRDPGKKQSKEYQLWLQQQEFNPFLKNAWLLLAKSEYQNKDYLLASSTFSYIMRLYKNDPEVVMEARLWLARTYLAMGWLYEAEDIFYNINVEGDILPGQKGLYSEIYADLLLRKKDYTSAVPFIESAIKDANGIKKIRLKYILGQVYALLGNREKAYTAFQNVKGLNTPYNYIFNAKIQQATFVDDTNRDKILSDLRGMANSIKNKEYLDQIFYAIGNIYLTQNDTVKAIEEYKKAISQSTRNGYDKAVVQVLLGDIQFKQKNYIDAQPNYSEALNNLTKKDVGYARVELRSKVLEELVVFVKAIHLQDSLQEVALMPEINRVKIIQKIIVERKKKDQEEKRKQLAQDGGQNAGQSSSTIFDPIGNSIPTGPSNIGSNSKASFYFYNQQTVEQGKNSFQRRWGNRKQEDNWRRANKQSSIFAKVETNIPVNSENPDSTINSKNTEEKEDFYSIDYYMSQLPLTPETLKKSNEIIEDAYFNMGKIYKDKLEDYYLAIEAFETDLKRFSDTPNLKEIYYQLFLIYLRLGNREKTELYRSYLLNTFPDSDYAKTLTSPDYEWNLRNVYKIQDNLYQETYDAYLAGNVNTVRENYQSIMDKYPLSDLIPKFMYLNALTYAQTMQPKELKEYLSTLIQKYPKADVTPIASEMLKGLLAGRTLATDSNVARGMIWDMKFSTANSDQDSTSVNFIANVDTEYILLFIYPSNTINKNQLLYDIADYNFSKFVYKTFDLNFNDINGLDLIQVRGYDSLKDIIDYINLAFEKNSLMDHLDSKVITVPISADNYVALMNGKSLNEYFIFFEKNYSKEMINLIRLWTKQRSKIKEEEKVSSQENTKTEQKVDEAQNNEQKESNPGRIESISVEPEDPKKQEDSNKSAQEIGVQDVLSDETIEQADKIINKAIELINNPIDGLKGIFNSSVDTDNLTKEEKAALKKAKKEEKEKEKQAKKAERDRLKQEQEAKDEAQKYVNDSIAAQKKIEEEKIRNEQLAKETQLQAVQKAKEDAVKERKDEQKRKEQERKEKIKLKQQERNERLKQKEQERKNQLKERKEKERLAKERKKKKT